MLVARRALGADRPTSTASPPTLRAARRASTATPPMAGRTLLQQAVPTTFGLKAAGWLVAVARGPARRLGARSRSPCSSAAPPARWPRSATTGRGASAVLAGRARAGRAGRCPGTPTAAGRPSSAPRSASPPARSGRSPATSSCSRRPRSARWPRRRRRGGSSTHAAQAQPGRRGARARLRAAGPRPMAAILLAAMAAGARARGRRLAGGVGGRSASARLHRRRRRRGARGARAGWRCDPSGCARTSSSPAAWCWPSGEHGVRRADRAPAGHSAGRGRVAAGDRGGPDAARGARRRPEMLGSSRRRRSTRARPAATSAPRRVHRPRARAYEESGERRARHRFDGPDEAPVVLLANSLGTTFEMWDAQVPRARGALPGAALRPPRPRRLARLARARTRSTTSAATCSALLDQLGIERVAFCGLSIGGMTGMWLAANAPERVDRLALCCTLGAPAAAGALARARRDGPRRGHGGGRRRRDRALVHAARSRSERPEVVERMRAMLRRDRPPRATPAAARRSRDIDLRAELGADRGPDAGDRRRRRPGDAARARRA